MKTRIEKIDQVDPEISILREAASIIREGGTVVFPTETVYGLGANAYSSEACSKVFRAKNRPEDNPLIVHVFNREQLLECTVDQDPEMLRALESIWPGPLTVLMKRGARIPDNVTAGLETVAVRMPANPLALKLIELSGCPIAAPSANIATRPSIVDSAEAISELDGLVDMILDAGPTFFGIESTIINTMKRPVELLRPGAYNQDDLRPYFGEIRISDVARGLEASEMAITPGMKYKHYAPDREMYVISDPEILRGSQAALAESGIMPIMSTETLADLSLEGISLGSSGNLYEIAKNLFTAFRKLERSGSRTGIIESFPETGVGLAVMNRIRKASSGTISTPGQLHALLGQ